MIRRPNSLSILLASSLIALSGCGVLSSWTQSTPAPVSKSGSGKVGAGRTVPAFGAAAAPANHKAHDVVLFGLGLIETGYRFGGKNPEAGLDCSGMVNYVFDKAADRQLGGSAADLARKGKPVAIEQLRPGDLVFFNTSNRPYSHVGIYIGDARFIHAPNSRGKVRAESLANGWFAARFEEARTYFD
jgi:cell wall-associated NlpC family hydrolase